MSVSTGRLALLLVLAVPATAVAQNFSYATGTSQYRITTSMKGAQEAMGQRQEVESSSNQLLTLAVSRAGRDTLEVTATIDSIAVVGPMGMTPPGMDKIPGTKIRSRISPTGQVYSATGPSPDSLPNATQLIEEVSNIFPKLRQSLASGAAWTDTVTRKGNQGGIDLERKIIVNYQVTGDTTVAGQKGMKVSRKTSTAISGSGAQGGQPMTVEGTSTGAGVVVVTPSGQLLGFVTDEQVNLKVLLAANGMEVGVTQNATTKLEKVK